jgi:hypothetical protein
VDGDTLRLIGVAAGPGVTLTPNPLSATRCGLPAALEATIRLALWGPLVWGVKLMLMAHRAYARTVPPTQPLFWAKVLPSLPAMATLVIRREVAPRLTT